MLENAPKIPLMNEEQRFRLFIDAVVDYAIYMTDPSGIITSLSLIHISEPTRPY